MEHNVNMRRSSGKRNPQEAGGGRRAARAGAAGQGATRPSGDAAGEKRSGRLLALLGGPDAYAMPDPTQADMVILRTARGGVSVGAGRFERALAEDLVRRDLAAWSRDFSGPCRLTISVAGRAHLCRRAESGDESFLAQHIETAYAEVEDEAGTGRVRVRVDADESPLDWLRRRKGRDGQPLIDERAYDAGERLRRDLTLAGMMPSVTMRWDAAGSSGSRRAGRDPASATDAAIAARQRTAIALDAVGPDFADLLIDLCGFLKGLELIERERGWPTRSAKVVVGLALAHLADHYGLERLAEGPKASRGIRAWRALVAEPRASRPEAELS